MSDTAKWTGVILVLVGIGWGCQTSPVYRPGQEFRTINAAEYEIVVQKNGRVNVLLRSGQVILANAQPMVWYEKDSNPKPLPVLGRLTAREQVNDRLGQGQGMLFRQKECEWAIRVYPDKPFFTCQAAYVNRSKKPVKIRALIPWFIGDTTGGQVSLGSEPESTVILQNTSPFAGLPQTTSITQGEGESLWYLAGFNPVSRQSLIAGFVTSDTGYGSITLGRSKKAKASSLNQFSAACYFDPPVEVMPGGKVQSEVLYISVAEKTPLEGLERYGHAVAAVNEVPVRKPPLPHGSTALSKTHGDLSEEAIRREMDVLEADLLRYGWNNVAIGMGWESAPGDWEPDPATFPQGFAPLVQEIHARGLTASLYIDPFVVPAESSLAASHPDWLAPVASWAVPLLPENAHILDITVPEAEAYIRDLFQKIGSQWGFDSIEGVQITRGILAAESFADASLTRADVLRMAISAVDQGLGPGKGFAAMGAQSTLHVRADAVGTLDGVVPLWQGDAEHPGFQEVLQSTALRYFFSPYLYAPYMGPAYFNTPGLAKRWPEFTLDSLTTEQSTAWLTAMAINGSVMKIGNRFAELNADQKDILSRLLPTLPWTARPLDLFESNLPAVWSAQLRTKAGDWHYAAVFNGSTSEQHTATLYLGELGMNPQSVYTVYDYWNDQFHGLAQGQLNVQAPPGGVRLLGFRLYEKRPLLVASTTHFTQGALETASLEWDAPARELRGETRAIPNTNYGLRILVPEQFTVSEAGVSRAQPTLTQDGQLLELNFRNDAAQNFRWYVKF
ncbi:MAG: alpha-galactosidase [Candidatus Hydrogenedentales bacterium]|jgi:hypothetical protein